MTGARRFHLSRARVVRIPALAPSPRGRRRAAALFSEVEDVIAGWPEGARFDVAGLPLAEFHTLRALLMRLGHLAEEAVEITCRNCEAAIHVAPCAALALGPFEFGELEDPELDVTLDLTQAHGRLGVTLAPRTRGEATSLHRALRRRRYAITADLVAAMGVVAVGSQRDPTQVAHALMAASEEDWAEVTAAFLDAHYPLRLGAVVACAGCGARNDVDAPLEREFDRAGAPKHAAQFPTFVAFARRAEELARECLPEDGSVAFVVEGGVPACDDGGEPLLGSYVPAYVGDATSPTRAAEVTVYYRTFRAVWDEGGAFAWDEELRETIEHELEHHAAAGVGHDPLDDEERDAIRREALRVHGRRALARDAARGLAGDFGDFLRRTWPLWVLVLLLTVVATLSEQ